MRRLTDEMLLQLLPAIAVRLRSEGCADTSDRELIRCLKDCAKPTLCIQAAQALRDSGRLTELHLATDGKEAG